MPNDPENLIEFHGPIEVGDPAPFRAVGVIPEWLKHLEPQRSMPDGKKVDTIKRCAPFVDAIGCGYILPLRRSVHFRLDHNGKLQVQAGRETEVVLDQLPASYGGAPFENAAVVKFQNTWVIKTPPGYSTLFLPLLNRVDFPFQILAGLVETDTYYREVYFPSICLMARGTEVVLEKGTPLVQLIPLKREAWRSESRGWEMHKRADAEVEHLSTRHQYKQEHWTKKDYR